MKQFFIGLERVFIDASHVRAHQHVAGVKDQTISKSIGGNSSKIHLAVDANGNPIEFIIGDGTTHDVKVAPNLIDALDLKETEILCEDQGYDSELLREKIENNETKVNIPKKCNSESSNQHIDWYLYKIRCISEKCICKIETFSRNCNSV